MQGMSNLFYWIGLFMADLILLIFPYVLFSLFVLITQTTGFSENLGDMTVIVFTFGASLISLIYIISTAFKDSVTAGKCIAPILILLGNIAPAVILPILFTISVAVADHAGDKGEEIGLIFTTLVYMLNPFATFFVGCYTIITNHWIIEHWKHKQENYCVEYKDSPYMSGCCNVTPDDC